MEKVKFEKLFYENDCNMYKRGRFLLKKYSDIPKEVITSHNNIPSLRAYENKQFPKLKNYLILGNNDYCPQIKDGKSNKQKKAEKLKLSGQDIEIISENTFYEMLDFEA